MSVLFALREPVRVTCSTGVALVATEAGRSESGLVLGVHVVVDGGPLFAHRLFAMLPESQEAFARRVQVGTRTPSDEVLRLLSTLTVGAEEELRKGPAPRPVEEAEITAAPVPWRTIIRPLGDVLAEADVETDWLVRDLIPAGWVGMLAGETKMGKTLLTLEIARAVATGGTVLGRQAEKGPVLLALVDDPPALSRKRLRETLADCAGNVYVRIERWKPEVAVALDEAVEELAPRLVVIDTLVKCVSSLQGDENDASVMDRIVERFSHWTANLKTTVLLIHHLNKAGQVRGSTAITGAAPFVLTLRKPGEEIGEVVGPDGRTGRLVQLAIDWKLEPVEPVLLAQSEGGFVVVGTTAQATETSTRRHILHQLDDHPDGLMVPDIARRITKRDEDVRALLDAMETEGVVEHFTRRSGKRGQPALVWRRVVVPLVAQNPVNGHAPPAPPRHADEDEPGKPDEAAIVGDMAQVLAGAVDRGSLESQLDVLHRGQRWAALSVAARQEVQAAYSACMGRLRAQGSMRDG